MNEHEQEEGQEEGGPNDLAVREMQALYGDANGLVAGQADLPTRMMAVELQGAWLETQKKQAEIDRLRADEAVRQDLIRLAKWAVPVVFMLIPAGLVLKMIWPTRLPDAVIMSYFQYMSYAGCGLLLLIVGYYFSRRR